ncbi:hypothetical protein RFM99_20270 [Mesorhizobium sp. VK4C]|uniref:hypothetical protein n=1 Tax=Mesorhizobium captivum TaxID=3072319 RepID=UPI002A24107E|nr:hypothetical protein [Mesorhizobium sp. VK4C]MDX8500743.1 hypothetical protein [Mesorhizobium sp. VK4C]
MSKSVQISGMAGGGNVVEQAMTWLGSWSSSKGLQTIDDGPIPLFGTSAPDAGEHHGDSTLRASATGEASPEDGGSPAVETSVRGNSNGADQAAARIGDLISTRGITPTWAGDGGLKLTGLAEAAARIGIHLDDTTLDAATANGFDWWHRAGLADSAHPASPDTIAGASTTATAAMLTVNSALGADPIFETRIASAGDDVEQKNSGAMSTNVSDLELGYDGSTAQTDGLRFTGINVPKGAIITNAYIQFQANEVKTGAASLLIQGANVDDASAFTSKVFNVSSLPRTTASTAWTEAGSRID